MPSYNSTIGSWDALDFSKLGSETFLIAENGMNTGDTYSLLLDLHLILSSVKTSLEVIVKNEEQTSAPNDLALFTPLPRFIAKVQDAFARNFIRQYPRQQRI
jgi:hypothetical protein